MIIDAEHERYDYANWFTMCSGAGYMIEKIFREDVAIQPDDSMRFGINSILTADNDKIKKYNPVQINISRQI
ncbi:hypothetical protein BLA29_011782 [Euroglyphus maynei]|uniref:Uncharacterized protein n=1 Tax=Euroglyphus maynei TaxID=6958 RepID=A0A1Y3AWL7_EURMA|nr:hypothetical protein BLA29_011782 [Euroglyphus maynei]